MLLLSAPAVNRVPSPRQIGQNPVDHEKCLQARNSGKSQKAESAAAEKFVYLPKERFSNLHRAEGNFDVNDSHALKRFLSATQHQPFRPLHIDPKQIRPSLPPFEIRIQSCCRDDYPILNDGATAIRRERGIDRKQRRKTEVLVLGFLWIYWEKLDRANFVRKGKAIKENVAFASEPGNVTRAGLGGRRIRLKDVALGRIEGLAQKNRLKRVPTPDVAEHGILRTNSPRAFQKLGRHLVRKVKFACRGIHTLRPVETCFRRRPPARRPATNRAPAERPPTTCRPADHVEYRVRSLRLCCPARAAQPGLAFG